MALGLLIASWTDVRTGIISNRLNGQLIGIGIIYWTVVGPWWSIWVGLLLAFAIHFPLWIIQVEKGGDAKLMMAIGALTGWRMMVETTLWCSVLYLPVGITLLAFKGRLGNVLPAVAFGLKKATGRLPGFLLPYAAGARALAPGEVADDEEPEVTMLRTGPVIAAAWGLAWSTEILGRYIS